MEDWDFCENMGHGGRSVYSGERNVYSYFTHIFYIPIVQTHPRINCPNKMCPILLND